MKLLVVNKDINTSLLNIDNYNKNLNESVLEICEKYIQLIKEYYKFVGDNIKIKNKNLFKFIVKRGLDTITHVFLFILFYTKNIFITYYHCQKSFYFYIEFVSQISEDEKMFLQLTSRDACTYVYKKTIFEINNEIKKSHVLTTETKNKLDIINTYVSIFKTYMIKIIYDNNFENGKYMNLFDKVTNKLISYVLSVTKIKEFDYIVDKLFFTINDVNYFFEVNQYIVKKMLKNNSVIDNCKKNISSEDYKLKLEESSDKFIHWITS
jgi:hypothetical protein